MQTQPMNMAAWCFLFFKELPGYALAGNEDEPPAEGAAENTTSDPEDPEEVKPGNEPQEQRGN